MIVGYLSIVDLLEGESVIPPDANLSKSLRELEQTVAASERSRKALTSERCSPRETLRTLGSEEGRRDGILSK